MSNESKHTPGPWIVMHGDNGYPSGISAPGDAGIPGAVGCIVRNGGIGLPSSDAGKANARLIAAAPDLLAALEELDVYVRRWNKSGHILFSESGMVGKRISAIRATIARAKEAAKP